MASQMLRGISSNGETVNHAIDEHTEKRRGASATLSALGSSRDKGLAGPEAASRLERDGPNEVPEQKSHPLLGFARKFWGLSAWMLELIAVLSFILGKVADFWIALSLLAVNAVLSFL